MKKIQAALAVLVVALPLAAAQPGELDRAASAISGTQAQFTQKFVPKGFHSPQVESGTVLFGTLPMMRWTYTRPEAKTFVFDGTRSWFYVAADQQVTVHRLSEESRRELPFLLLNDPAARAKVFNVREQRQGSKVVTTLDSKGGGLLRSIVITTDAASHLIQSVAYSDREGNQTTFELSGFQRKAAPAEMFRFDAPTGVEVIQAD